LLYDVIIVGGGWAGCSAALGARKRGATVLLLERTDMLLGTGLVGGIMRNNGRYTAAEEMIAMGAGELFVLCDENSRHSNVDFPGHKHASFYDVLKMPSSVTDLLIKKGVDIKFKVRVNKANLDKSRIISIESQSGEEFEGKYFIDATGTAGPTNNCVKQGNGCAMCVIRCPSFGGRVSLASCCGVSEYEAASADGHIGAMSGSCKLNKESLSENIKAELEANGVAIIPIPDELRENHLARKACQQYALNEYKDNIVLLDTGHAKMMTPYFPLEKLHRIPGLEKAFYVDPYSGGIGNSMRFIGMCQRENNLKVSDTENLYCGGEKAGPLVGHTEAIVTGTLAGFNAAGEAKGFEPIEYPVETAIGFAISMVRSKVDSVDGRGLKYTFSGSVLFEEVKKIGLYTTDKKEIRDRVEKVGFLDYFNSAS